MTGKRTGGHDLTLVKGQSRLGVREYYFPQMTVNDKPTASLFAAIRAVACMAILLYLVKMVNLGDLL